MPDDIKSVYHAKGQVMDHTTYCILDLETTGLSSVYDDIIEIGIAKVQSGKIIDKFHCFVKPTKPISKKVAEITDITNEMVKEAETINQVFPKMLEFLGNCKDTVIVAHNAQFDIGFLKQSANKLGYCFDYTYLDTLILAKYLFPNCTKYKLESIAQYLKIAVAVSHRAFDDVMTLEKVFHEMLEKLISKGIKQVEDINKLINGNIDFKKLPYYHATILVKNDVGLKNLYKLVSFSNFDYFHKVPKIPKSLYKQNSEGLIIGSACKEGELYKAIVKGDSDEEIEQIASHYDYLEIQPIENNDRLIRDSIVKDEKKLENINIKIVEVGEKLNKLVVATSDTHFLNKENEIYRRILMTGQGYQNIDEQPPLYFRTTKEMLKEFEYLGPDKAYEVVVTNTNKIAKMCEKIKPISNEKCYPHIKDSEIEIKDLAYKGAYKRYGNQLPEEVQERLDKELNSIIENGFATLYMIAQKLVKKSNEDGYMVGSRGSVASSLVAYCVGITEIDPIKYNIPFETFAGFYGEREPDFDLNFAKEYQTKAQEYVKEILDGGTIVKAGTIGTIAEKTAYEYVKKYYEDRNMKLCDTEIQRLVQGLTGIKRTTGQHPGRVIVVPKDREIYEFCPLQHPTNDVNVNVITTHFDYHSIDQNLLQLDLLSHDDLTMLHRLQELTGIAPTTIPLDDEETMKMICCANTLGIPEFGTKFVRNMMLETKPTTFDELIKISGLSHGTDVWLNNVQNLIKSKTATLKEVVACRDDIMNDLEKAGVEPRIAFEIMETVRKGKVRNNREIHWEEYKNIMKKHNIPEWYIKSCEKICYMFPKAHATAYTINAFKIAWYKVHFPEAFYKAYGISSGKEEDLEMLDRKQ